MDLRLKEVLCNLKNYDFDILGNYKMDVNEAQKLIDALEELEKGPWNNNSLEESNIINASDIKQDDEWMQENEWDEVYKKENITPCVEDAEVEKTFVEDVEKVKDLLPCDNELQIESEEV